MMKPHESYLQYLRTIKIFSVLGTIPYYYDLSFQPRPRLKYFPLLGFYGICLFTWFSILLITAGYIIKTGFPTTTKYVQLLKILVTLILLIVTYCKRKKVTKVVNAMFDNEEQTEKWNVKWNYRYKIKIKTTD